MASTNPATIEPPSSDTAVRQTVPAAAAVEQARQQAIADLRLLALLVFPLFVVVYIILFFVDRSMYLATLGEEDYPEQLSFVFLMLSGVLALVIFARTRRVSAYGWFFLAFGVACFLLAMEEISWGQRALGVTTPDFFKQRSDQDEINLHNLLQGLLDIRTKDVAGLVLLFYGGVLPFFAAQPRLAGLLRRFYFVVPPRFLTLGFILGAILMLDVPTTDEEELGEFLFALCFFVFMLYELLARLPDEDWRRVGVWARRTPLLAARTLAVALPGALALLTFGVSLWGITRRPLTIEEAALVEWAYAPPAALLHGAWQRLAAEPLFWPLLLRAWIAAAGASLLALRFVPVIAATLGVVLFWRLSAYLRLPAALRVIAALLWIFSPWSLFYSQHVTAHNLTLLCLLASLWLLAGQVTTGARIRRLVALVAINWLMLLLNPYTAAILFAELLWVGWVWLRAREARLAALPWTAGALLVSALPLALLWMLPGGLPTAAAGGGVWRLGEQASLLLRGQPTLGVYAGLVNPVAALLSSLLLGGLIVAAALGVARLWQRRRGQGLAAAVVLLAVLLWGNILHYYRIERDEFREVADHLEIYAHPGDAALLEIPQQYFPLRYYLRDSLGDTLRLLPVPEIDLSPASPAWAAMPAVIPQVIPEVQDDQILDALQRHPSLWLVHYEDRAVDPNAFVRHFLIAVAHHADCVVWPALEVCGFISPHSIQTARTVKPDLAVGHELLLDSVDLALPQETDHGQPYLLVTLHWQVLKRPALDYKVSLRLVDEAGGLLDQQDDLLIGPLLPPTTWAVGEAKIGHLALRLPPIATPGRYTVQALVYDGATGAPVEARVAGAVPDEPLIPLARLVYDQGSWSHE